MEFAYLGERTHPPRVAPTARGRPDGEEDFDTREGDTCGAEIMQELQDEDHGARGYLARHRKGTTGTSATISRTHTGLRIKHRYGSPKEEHIHGKRSQTCHRRIIQ